MTGIGKLYLRIPKRMDGRYNALRMPRHRKRTRRRTKKSSGLALESHTRSAIWGVLEISFGILLFLSLSGRAGIAKCGERLADVVLRRVGTHIFPVFLIVSGLIQWFAPDARLSAKRSVGLLLCLFSFLGLMHLGAPLEDLWTAREELAGVIGFLMSLPFRLFLSATVGYVVLATSFLVGLFIAFEPDIVALREAFLLPFKQKPKRHLTLERVEPEEFEEEEEEEEDREDLVEQDREPAELNIVRPAFAQATAKSKADKAKAAQKLLRDVMEMKDTRFEEWTFPGSGSSRFRPQRARHRRRGTQAPGKIHRGETG